MKKAVFVGALGLVLTLAARPMPSSVQHRYLETEIMGIVHYGLNTYADMEWGYGDTPPSVFAPTSLDAEQWVVAAASAGIRRLVLVCKHHDGFCLFPSKLCDDYTIANTPWKDGKGDLVREVRDACFRHGMEFGAYLSPWDRHQASYGTAAYADYFQGQWDELLADYGPLYEVWLDGANGGDGWYGGARERRKLPKDVRAYYRLDELDDKVSKHNPLAIVYGGGNPSTRATWCGNEIGMNSSTCWNEKDGVYVPRESDTPLRRNGWFWHPDDKPKSLAELVDVYFLTVGRNSVLNLGLAPNRCGVLGEDDVRRLKEFGDYVRRFNAVDVAEGATIADCVDGHRLTRTLRLREPSAVNAIDLKEEIRAGQVVGRWTAEVEVDGEWRPAAEGTTVGYRRMERFTAVTTSVVRLTFDGEGRLPVMKGISLRHAAFVKQEEDEPFNQWRSPFKVREIEPGVLEYDFLRRITVNAIQFVPPKDKRIKGLPDRYEIQTSDDGKVWTKVHEGEFGNLRANPVRQVQPLPARLCMRYVRVRALHALDGDPDWSGILFEFFTRK